jgi:hypothetical protein
MRFVVSGARPESKEASVAGDKLLLDAEKSVIKWTEANLTNSHAVTLRFTGGALRLREDIKDAEVNQMLVRQTSGK